MPMLVFILLVFLSLNSAPVMAQSSCGIFRANVPAPGLDLAPPRGFVEICSKDFDLCAKVVSGYPPSAKTVGYFVTVVEWQLYREGHLARFTRYLIAQVAEGKSPSDFSGLKDSIRSRQGDIPDNARLSPVFDSAGRFNFGVFEDSDDAIASGAIRKLQLPTPEPAPAIVVASANIAFLAKERVLSLYAFVEVTDRPSAEPVKQLAREWIKCLRSAK